MSRLLLALTFSSPSRVLTDKFFRWWATIYQKFANRTFFKDINMNEEYELHRACSSFNPIEDNIYGIVRCKGLSNFQVSNALGITPAQYLAANPYADIDQHKLIKRYIAEMMGETV